MSLSNVFSRRWEKVKSALESLDRAFTYSPLDDQARRLAAIESRMDAMEELIGRDASCADITTRP